MKRSLPPVLSGNDPLSPRTDLMYAVTARAEEAVRSVRASQAGRRRAPVLLIVGATIDSLRDASVERPDVDLIDQSELEQAASRANIDTGALEVATQEELRGYWSAIRGAAGELHVTEQLASGELPLPVGTDTAQLEGFTVPGRDISFFVGDDYATAANVKIASSADVIVEHFARYAETVPIVYASSDAAADAAERGYSVIDATQEWVDVDGPVVVDIGVPSNEFDEIVTGDLADAPLDLGVDLDADRILDEFPWLATGMIGVRAVYRLAKGASAADVARATGRDATTAAAAITGGKLVATLGGPDPVSFAAGIAAGWSAHAALEVRRAWKDHGDSDEALADRLGALAAGWAR